MDVSSSYNPPVAVTDNREGGGACNIYAHDQGSSCPTLTCQWEFGGFGGRKHSGRMELCVPNFPGPTLGAFQVSGLSQEAYHKPEMKQ